MKKNGFTSVNELPIIPCKNPTIVQTNYRRKASENTGMKCPASILKNGKIKKRALGFLQ